MAEQIKAKINLHMEGEARPFHSVEEFQQLKAFFKLGDDADSETWFKEIEVEGKMYEIADTVISIRHKTTDDNLKYGMDMALQGESQPYNFRVSLWLKEK
jgi:hypothetical protein